MLCPRPAPTRSLSRRARHFGLQSIFSGPSPSANCCESAPRGCGALTLERGVAAGIAVFLLGTIGIAAATVWWGVTGFETFPRELTRALVIPSAFALILGVQVVLNSFVLSIIALEHIGSPKDRS